MRAKLLDAEGVRKTAAALVDADIGQLYAVRTRRLYRRFEWYPPMLADYAAQIRRLAVESENVVKRTDAQLERMK